MEHDLLNVPRSIELRQHKLRRLVPAPNSYFLKIKCAECGTISLCFSHAQTAIACNGCNKKICKTTGGKVKIAGKCAFTPLGVPKPPAPPATTAAPAHK